tara:strand:- start:207 stop:443 length:237 start_codon:yes stop_codon:yes gene_type:complete
MFLKLQLISMNIASSLLLVFFLCLGSQNLNDRHKINFLNTNTVPLPAGFIVGFSFALGFLSGGITSTFLNNDKAKLES